MSSTARESAAAAFYSRDAPDRESPAHVEETFREILEYELPIQLLEEPHPEALVPPEERRTLTND